MGEGSERPVSLTAICAKPAKAVSVKPEAAVGGAGAQYQSVEVAGGREAHDGLVDDLGRHRLQRVVEACGASRVIPPIVGIGNP